MPADEYEHLTVSVVHEHPILRRGLTTALSEMGLNVIDLEGVGIGRGSAGAQCTANRMVVFASLAEGLDLLNERRRPMLGGARSLPAVAIIDTALGQADASDALRAGARGLLELNSAPAELLDCARTLAAGGHHVARPLAALLALQVVTQPLTDREEQVMQLVLNGCCNKSIARELGIALGTVKTHVKAILSKLDAGSRTEAIALAQRRGLLRRVSKTEPRMLPAHQSAPEFRSTVSGGVTPHLRVV